MKFGHGLPSSSGEAGGEGAAGRMVKPPAAASSEAVGARDDGAAAGEAGRRPRLAGPGIVGWHEGLRPDRPAALVAVGAFRAVARAGPAGHDRMIRDGLGIADAEIRAGTRSARRRSRRTGGGRRRRREEGVSWKDLQKFGRRRPLPRHGRMRGFGGFAVRDRKGATQDARPLPAGAECAGFGHRRSRREGRRFLETATLSVHYRSVWKELRLHSRPVNGIIYRWV